MDDCIDGALLNAGLNALPLGVNMTVFRQYEPWQTDVVAETRTCTWQKVLERLNVAKCETS